MAAENHAGDPALRYASGEEVRVGDIVMEPVNASDAEAAPAGWDWDPIFWHEAYGKVIDVSQPGSDDALLVGFPEGCCSIEWRRSATIRLMAQDVILEEDYLFFVGRG